MTDGSKSKLGWATAALALGFAGLLAGQFYTLSVVRSMETTLSSIQTEQAEARLLLDNQVAKLQEADAAAGMERQQAIEALKTDVDATRRQAVGAAGAATKAQIEAQRQAEALADRLKENEQKVQENQARLASELTGVRQANSTTQSNVSTVSTEVAAVKTEVASTRTQLNQTAAELQRTRGDLGELSGLIATNADQIQALRALGDRDYVEFTLFKAKDPVRVGDISLVLKNADVKNSRYSVDMYVNDVRIEKKDRTINEPLQFFVGSDKQPHELVVNRVAKDQIVGYIASPKAGAAR